MRRVRPTGQFRKDLKLGAKRGLNLYKLHRIISLLRENEPLPLTAYPHRLSGKYEGSWECHIESDWLLIYAVTNHEVLLVRTGTHNDLFE